MNGVYFDSLLMYKCNVLGTAFSISSSRYNYDSEDFVKKVMTDKSLDWLFSIDDCQEWCDGYFLMSVLDYYLDFKSGKCEDDYAMWWLGYLYKYWKNTRGASRYEIYKILPLKRFMVNFNFYHTQGWDFVIDEAIRDYKNHNYIV